MVQIELGKLDMAVDQTSDSPGGHLKKIQGRYSGQPRVCVLIDTHIDTHLYQHVIPTERPSKASSVHCAHGQAPDSAGTKHLKASAAPRP